MTDLLKGAESAYRAELRREGVPARKIEQALEGFREEGNLSNLIAIRETDGELGVLMEKALELLKREWGAWKINQNGKVVFEHAGVPEEFNEHMRQIREVSARQEELQESQFARKKQPKSSAN